MLDKHRKKFLATHLQLATGRILIDSGKIGIITMNKGTHPEKSGPQAGGGFEELGDSFVLLHPGGNNTVTSYL